MLNFKLSLPTEIFFGKGQIKVLGEQVKRHGGTRALICYGSRRIKQQGIFDAAAAQLTEKGISFCELGGIEPNPRITSVREGVRIVKEHDINFLIAIGGGSVIDATKAIAAGAHYHGDPWDLFTGKGKVKTAVPLGTVLTLAATGSEMNSNSVVSNLETKQKLAIHYACVKPKFSILAPTYTSTVPPLHTAAGVADIMSHVWEQYFSDTPGTIVQDRLAEAILHTCITCGPIPVREPENYEARANLMWASTLALNELLSYGKATDWGTHVIEHAVSAHYDVTHGVGLAILFPHWMAYVLDERSLDKFFALAVNVWRVPLTADRMDAAREGIARTREFFTSLGLPARLREVGVPETALPAIAKTAVEFGPVGGWRKLGEEAVLEILRKAY